LEISNLLGSRLPLTNINGTVQSDVYQAESVVRKRRKKMRKHKLKKLRKEQRFERKKLGK
jgi:hypothetical protein